MALSSRRETPEWNTRLPKPPRILSIIATLWLLFILAVYSESGVGLEGLFLLVFGALALSLAWIVRFSASLATHPRRNMSANRGWWLVLPVWVVLAVVLGIWFEAPNNPMFWLRFRISEPSLRRNAEELLAASDETGSPGRIGLFLVRRIETHEGQVRFITSACGVVDSCGFVYSPNGAPQRWQEDRFSHLRGPWWHLYEGF